MGRGPAPPGETVLTFLFTDVEGSTRRWQDDPEMPARVREHDRVLRAAVEAASGRVFKQTGDGCCAVFRDPLGAVEAAVEAQRALAGTGLRARMAIHTGPVEAVGDDFLGHTLNRCARIMAAGHGGQILLSLAAEELARDRLAPADVVDLGLHELRDLTRAEHLFQVVAPGLERRFPPLRSARPGVRLPSPRAQLVGRDAEVAEVADLLSRERLVTLTGAGGSGKTRLAIEVAGGSVAGDEVAFADLSGVGDPGLVPTVVGTAVGMPGAGTLDELTVFLGPRSTLVVLDNCEHLLDACAELADVVLERCDGTRLLATSREPLGVDGERVWRVPSLATGDAVALLVERAGAVNARVDADDPVVGELCDRLDRLPLAIELAAAQAARLPLDEIAAMLDERFRLLRGGSRRGQRQQTLEAAMDWSYGLLDEAQQRLLRHLTVFAGGFTVDAVGAVCNDGPWSRAETAARLGELVDKSLVVLGPAAGRYSLLETVRLYGRQRLFEAGETQAAHDRHEAWLLDWLPGPWSWMEEDPTPYEAELDNLRAALAWCEAGGRPERAVRVAAWAGPVWFHTTQAVEGLEWLRLGESVDHSLSLDERLAWRTASAWCRLALAGDSRDAVAEGLALAPPGHPAIPTLLCIRGWTENYADPTAASRTWQEVRAAAGDADGTWQTTADYLEAAGKLVVLDCESAVAGIRAALADRPMMHRGHPHYMLTVALHLLERHEEAAEAAAVGDRVSAGGRAYFVDLARLFARVVLAVGRDDLDAARRELGGLVSRTMEQYGHLPSAWGIALQGAAVTASVAGDHDGAVTLLAGAGHHMLHVRYEGGMAAGRFYGRRSRAALPDERVAAARRAGESMSVNQLVELAASVAAAGDPPRR